MVFQNNLLAGVGGQGDDALTVDDSVRYNDDDSPRLYRTPSNIGNRMVGSISLWYKRCNLGSIQQLFNSGAGNDISFNASDKLTFTDGFNYITTQVFRDPSAWGHLLFAWDTTLTTAGDRLRIYHNGVEITAFDTETNAAQFLLMSISDDVLQTIGANESNTEEFDGYLSQVYLVDGAQLTPTSFGEFDDNGVWRPISYAGGDTVTSWIDASGETLIGNATSAGGLSAAWDGNPTKGYLTCAAAGSPPGTIGIDWGSGNTKTITRMITVGSSDYGYSSPGRTINIKLEGSTDNFSSSVVDLGGGTGDFSDATANSYKMVTPTSTTAYRYHRFYATSSVGSINVAQVFLYEEETGYGTNGFFLDFADSSTLGNDVSGNNNDYTSAGLAANDQMSDTPTNNKCTWSSISHGPTTGSPLLSNGNLDITYPPADKGLTGTMGVIGSGKYYWEYEMTSGTGGTPAQLLGMVSQPYAWAAGIGSLAGGFRGYHTTGVKYTGGTSSSYGDSWAVGDRMGVAVDLDNAAMYFAKNNTWQDSGDPTSGASKTGAAFTDITASDGWVPFMHTGGNRYSTVNFNEDDFEYTPPTGYVALATSNLPTPTIPDGTANYQTTLYTGNGSIRNIDQTGNSTFQPDMVWIKNRSAADSPSVFDAILGVTKYWMPDTHSVETTNADSLTSFDSDGFGLGTGAGGWNDDTENFVAWQWLAGGGAGSSNEEGSINTITTTVNPAAGLSISTFTGNATGGATIGHGLGAAPEFMIAKSTTGGHNNIVYWKNLGGHYGTYMDLTNAPYDLAIYWNDVDPTSSLITLGTGATNTSSVKMLIYAFTSIEGFSKIGSYVGNGLDDGTYIYTGFRPAYVMVRRTSSTGGWVIHDNLRPAYNLSSLILSAENASAESTDYQIDLLSNGFKARDNQHYINLSGSTYAYIAFAEYPFGGDGVAPATAV